MCSINGIRLITALLSILLSLFAIFQADTIGWDAVWYIETSQAYLENGVTAAFQVYFWPFFSLFIAFIHQLTGLSLEYSAYALNILLAVLLGDIFLRIYLTLHSKTDTLWIAAAIILSFKSLLIYRGDIIKGIGCWSFALLSLLYFIAYVKHRRLAQALAWQLSIIVACLFRLETISLLLLTPWVVLFFKTNIKSRLIDLFKLNSLWVCAAIGYLLFLSLMDKNSIALYRLNHVWNYFDLHHLWGVYHQKIDIVANQVLSRFSKDYAGLMLTSGIIFTLTMQVLLSLGYINSAITFLGIRRFGFPSSIEFRLILLFFSITFLSIILFFSQSMIMTPRYLLLPSLFLVLITAYYYEKIILTAWHEKQNWLMTVVIVSFTVALIEAITTVDRDKYDIRDAGIWVKKNLPAHATLIANDPRLYYYSGRKVDYTRNQHWAVDGFAVNGQSIHGHDYALLRFKKNRSRASYKELFQSGQLIELHNFPNQNGDHSVLFRVQQ